MPKLSINKGGTWYTARKFSVNVGGTWQTAKKMWINKGGTWQAITFVNPTGNDFTRFTTTSPASLNWLATGDGTITGTSNVAWLDDIATGNGDNFWIKWESTGSHTPIISGASYSTWTQMTSGVSLTLTVGAGSAKSAAGTYTVSDNGGATTIGTYNWTLEVDRT